MHVDPFQLFGEWFAAAMVSEPSDANAMALATADAAGRPATRIVLLKSWDAQGFVFYTNLDSRKGLELAANPAVQLGFHWKSLAQQIRIDGRAELVSDTQADGYFATRVRDSQLGAWASYQSRPMVDRAHFEQRFAEMTARFAGGDVPRPPRWSGFRIVPSAIEFWQARDFRHHDRLRFTRNDIDADWQHGMLFP
jgi:pyridoxamine 5'-phosphate oxidase